MEYNTLNETKTLANFSKLAYKSESQIAKDKYWPDLQKDGWEIADSYKPTGLTDGYSATAFFNKVTGELVIANRGTDGAADIISDIKLALGYQTDQSIQATDFAEDVINKLGSDVTKITFTGHSLGSNIAIETLAHILSSGQVTIDMEAVVFESPGTGNSGASPDFDSRKLKNGRNP